MGVRVVELGSVGVETLESHERVLVVVRMFVKQDQRRVMNAKLCGWKSDFEK